MPFPKPLMVVNVYVNEQIHIIAINKNVMNAAKTLTIGLITDQG